MEWIPLTQRKPQEGAIVETKIDDYKGERNIQHLIFKGNLWWTKDMGMYVYYTPTHWRPIL